mgnify:CR=1 FL=1
MEDSVCTDFKGVIKEIKTDNGDNSEILKTDNSDNSDNSEKSVTVYTKKFDE